MRLKFSRKDAGKAVFTVLLVAVMIAAVCLTVFGAAPRKRGRVDTDPWIPLNVRSEAGTGSQVIASLKSGDIVTILGEKQIDGASGPEKWYLISTDAVTGYAASWYIEIIEDETSAPSGTTNPGETDGGQPPSTGDPSSGETTAPGDGSAEPPVITNFEEYLEQQKFPESYKPYLRELHALYPNWIFKAHHTGLEFEYSVEQQLDKSLVENYFPSSWKSVEGDAYDWTSNQWKIFDGDRWVRASREIIRHYMDPRNFLGVNSVFQFLDQSYDPEVQNVDGVKRIIEGTFMENDIVDADGANLNYADAIFNAGRDFEINPYILSSMIIIEVGSQGSSIMMGNHSIYPGYYNFYNIGAYNERGMDAVTRGLWYAAGGGNGSTSYLRPWNTRLKAIRGGAYFYANDYLNNGQNTLYLKRFNVQGERPFTHQYATGVYAPSVESTKLAKGYTEELRETPLTFNIPVYEKMPETPCIQPTLDGSPNMKLKSLSVSGYALTPDFDTETLEYMLVVPSGVNSITVNAEPMDGAATVSGNGELVLMAGSNVFEIRVTAGNGMVRVYKLTVAKENAENFGTLTFTQNYSPVNYVVFGISPGMTVADFSKAFVSVGSVSVSTAAGVLRSQGDAMASGDIITVTSTAGVKYADYTASVKGDLNGDGKINISDLLKIRNKILGSDQLSGVQSYSGDIDGGGAINISDLLKVRNHILGTAYIS